jgi:uncharacterized protein YndB with AHSA1/START domain
MGRVSASIELPHSPERVFRVATRIEDLPRWLPEVVEAELLDPALTQGSHVRLRMSPTVAGIEILGTVRQVRAPSVLAIGGTGGPLTIEVRTRLVPVGESSTRIALEVDLSASPLLGFVAREAERRINAELPASLERFRSLLDAEPD